MAVGFHVTTNGEWAPDEFELPDEAGFYNDALQEYLLPYFTVSGVAVDPYDGAEFRGGQLDILLQQLRAAVAVVGAETPEWPFHDGQQRSRYYESCRMYRVEPLAPRDQALRTLNEAIILASRARRRNESLVFIGD